MIGKSTKIPKEIVFVLFTDVQSVALRLTLTLPLGKADKKFPIDVNRGITSPEIMEKSICP